MTLILSKRSGVEETRRRKKDSNIKNHLKPFIKVEGAVSDHIPEEAEVEVNLTYINKKALIKLTNTKRVRVSLVVDEEVEEQVSEVGKNNIRLDLLVKIKNSLTAWTMTKNKMTQIQIKS